MLKILIVKTSSMGDIIHCLPIVADIRTHFPDAKIDWLTEEGFVDILKLHPHINRIIPVAIRRWRQHLSMRETWTEFSAFKQQLREQNYDVILDAQSLFKSAVLSTFARGKRYGQNYKTAREPIASLFYHHTYFVPRNQHAVEQNRALTASVLGYDLPTSAPDYGLTAAPYNLEPHNPELSNPEACKKYELNLPASFVIAFHATSRDSKLWPVSHWITLGQALDAQGYHLVLPWANEAELARANEISAKVANSVILPKCNLTTLASIIACAKAVIGVDTGLVHLAVALNVPTVAIYTDTFPALNGAYAGSAASAINIGSKAVAVSPEPVLQAFFSFNLSP